MQNRDNILNVALKEFLMKGYENSSINSICQKAGISKGGIYHHFKNKDELYHACLDIFLDQLDSWMSEMLVSAEDIEKFIFTYFSIIPKVKQELFGPNEKEEFSASKYYTLILSGISRYPQMQLWMNSSYKQLVMKIEQLIESAKESGIIRQDIDNEITAFELVTIFEGTLIMSVMKNDLELDSLTDRLALNFWNKIKI